MACSGTALPFLKCSYVLIFFMKYVKERSARNGNSEVPVYGLKAKQGYTGSKI
jgi:hypothetical protein